MAAPGRGDVCLRYVAATTEDADFMLGKILYKDMLGIRYILQNIIVLYTHIIRGGVFGTRSRGYGFEPQWRPYVVSLSKTLYPLLVTGSTQEDPSQHD